MMTLSHLEKEHAKALKHAENLSGLMTRFHYEGKASFGKNMKMAQDVGDYFSAFVIKHMEFEEKSLFPYLESHIPRLEPVIQLLVSEHDDFRDKLSQFNKALEKLTKRKSESIDWKKVPSLIESGTYLVHLLRQHTTAERTSLNKAIDKYLREDEKKELSARLIRHSKTFLACPAT